jgi:nucleotide-binding universal stress UspA family protein
MPVVAGVDGSEESQCAVEWAALEAQRHQTPLRIVAAPALASYSARADLFVIGRHDEYGSQPAIGGIQHALLNHARGPIAIVPATS